MRDRPAHDARSVQVWNAVEVMESVEVTHHEYYWQGKPSKGKSKLTLLIPAMDSQRKQQSISN